MFPDPINRIPFQIAKTVLKGSFWISQTITFVLITEYFLLVTIGLLQININCIHNGNLKARHENIISDFELQEISLTAESKKVIFIYNAF